MSDLGRCWICTRPLTSGTDGEGRLVVECKPCRREIEAMQAELRGRRKKCAECKKTPVEGRARICAGCKQRAHNDHARALATRKAQREIERAARRAVRKREMAERLAAKRAAKRAARRYTCRDCPAEYSPTGPGRVPVRCPDCRARRAVGAAQTRRSTIPEARERELTAQLLDLAKDPATTTASMGQTLGISPFQVTRLLAGAGIDVMARRRANERIRAEIMAARVAGGDPVAKVAADFGLGVGAVYTAVRKLRAGAKVSRRRKVA